ncbi:patatin-like phospholipase family protein [Pusillimonas sp. CC-YST705]|uniref:Patatin-like phospholipase family protein n=1 Tax=Mesopusillimonas faecipullorum TaxID=2755040 RepID=A0ABS8CFJ7_9BURK|nr:patatin-like phospholipase family protein [Mesopusillimonas faecipullorum]MCB5364822.1 patatin-like phospholipase family protein [Mesopusillimonas faecipullorum]
MNVEPTAQLTLPPYESVALLLQGGGALGAYQAGVYQGLSEAGITPNWLAGISIGALNIALIAGNPPERRLERLTEFWETICQPDVGLRFNPFIEHSLFQLNDLMRGALGMFGATTALLNGQKGFFRPRFPPPSRNGKGAIQSASYYDVSPLKETLERLCDFDLINDGPQHVAVGAVNVQSGNFVYFDNRVQRLRAEHFMASGALPPAFPAIEIDGEHYWDGGIVSNTPLSYVLASRPLRDTLAFQVDLWAARGHVPTNMDEVAERMKEIMYSSRTRLVTDQLHKAQQLRRVLNHMRHDLEADKREDAYYMQLADEMGTSARYNIVHLIYQHAQHESHYRDFDFSLSSMRAHWDSGLADIRNTLSDPTRLDMPANEAGFVTHDVHRPEE